MILKPCRVERAKHVWRSLNSIDFPGHTTLLTLCAPTTPLVSKCESSVRTFQITGLKGMVAASHGDDQSESNLCAASALAATRGIYCAIHFSRRTRHVNQSYVVGTVPPTRARWLPHRSCNRSYLLIKSFILSSKPCYRPTNDRPHVPSHPYASGALPHCHSACLCYYCVSKTPRAEPYIVISCSPSTSEHARAVV